VSVDMVDMSKEKANQHIESELKKKLEKNILSPEQEKKKYFANFIMHPENLMYFPQEVK
jgi:hypothetical protein